MRLALLGFGKMGRAIEALAPLEGHEVVAVRDDPAGATRGALANAEVAIEFTTPEAALPNILTACSQGVDLVVGTTGWYDRMDEARAAVEQAGIGLVWAPNFSLGVHLFYRLVREAGRLVDTLDVYDVYVHEVHHRHKLDHPSGTAKRIAEILVEAMESKERWEETSSGGVPPQGVLGVGASRAGEAPGTHWVGVEGPDDGIELKHVARGRTGFARGALAAARWIRGRQGFHSIDEMLAERLGAG